MLYYYCWQSNVPSNKLKFCIEGLLLRIHPGYPKRPNNRMIHSLRIPYLPRGKVWSTWTSWGYCIRFGQVKYWKRPSSFIHCECEFWVLQFSVMAGKKKHCKHLFTWDPVSRLLHTSSTNKWKSGYLNFKLCIQVSLATLQVTKFVHPTCFEWIETNIRAKQQQILGDGHNMDIYIYTHSDMTVSI